MIPNCMGCEEELHQAFEFQKEGYHLATSLDEPHAYPFGRHHFCLKMVNDKGKVMVS